MQTFLDMWNASPGGVILFSIPVLIFAGFVIGFVLSTAADVLQMLINGVVRVFRGHPPVAPEPADDDGEPLQANLSLDAMDQLATHLAKKFQMNMQLTYEAHGIDKIADILAARLYEQPAEIGDDDALVAKIADAVRDRVNEVTVSATDLDLFAAKVMELADKQRAERERAKAKQASKEGKYKRDDLVDVLDGDQWVPGWYVNFFKSHDGDLFPHHVAFIGGFNSDGSADIDDAYKPDYEVRRRRPAEVATTA